MELQVVHVLLSRLYGLPYSRQSSPHFSSKERRNTLFFLNLYKAYFSHATLRSGILNQKCNKYYTRVKLISTGRCQGYLQHGAWHKHLKQCYLNFLPEIKVIREKHLSFSQIQIIYLYVWKIKNTYAYIFTYMDITSNASFSIWLVKRIIVPSKLYTHTHLFHYVKYLRKY